MNVWSAIVLIVMTLVVGAVSYFTGSIWALLGIVPVVWLGSEIIWKGPRQI